MAGCEQSIANSFRREVLACKAMMLMDEAELNKVKMQAMIMVIGSRYSITVNKTVLTKKEDGRDKLNLRMLNTVWESRYENDEDYDG